jgi:hypothetical protein
MRNLLTPVAMRNLILSEVNQVQKVKDCIFLICGMYAQEKYKQCHIHIYKYKEHVLKSERVEETKKGGKKERKIVNDN